MGTRLSPQNGVELMGRLHQPHRRREQKLGCILQAESKLKWPAIPCSKQAIEHFPASPTLTVIHKG